MSSSFEFRTLSSPALGKITRRNGVAGQLSYTVDVTYPGEPASRVTFVGSTYGGSVVVCTPDNPGGTRVSDPDRLGKFGPEWVRRFYA